MVSAIQLLVLHRLQLQFPKYDFELKEEGQKKFIFDIIRKKFIPLTPEEYVRQHCIRFLISHYNINAGNIAIEKQLEVLKLKKRFDILVYVKFGPQLIVECKAPDVKLTQNTIIQICTYNIKFNAPFLWITNGMEHFWFKKTENGLEICGWPERI